MIAATTLAIFVVPVLFVFITKLSYGKRLKQVEQEAKIEHEIDQQIIENNM